MSLQLQYLREKIDTARNLLGVVETMRGLAAVNIRRAEAAAEQSTRYARTIYLSLHAALMQMGHSVRTSSARVDGVPTLLVVTTDMGLCGQFNERIVEYALDVERRVAEAPARWLVVGMRGLERLEAAGAHIVARLPAPGSVEAIPLTVAETFLSVQNILSDALGGPLLVVYNRPDDGSTFAGHYVQLFPFQPQRWHTFPEGEQPWRAVPMTSPSAEAMLPYLVREQVYIDLSQAFIQSFAAENAARLAAMKNASDNIDELLGELEASYRRERQDAITTELMELLGGVEAVRKVEES